MANYRLSSKRQASTALARLSSATVQVGQPSNTERRLGKDEAWRRNRRYDYSFGEQMLPEQLKL